MNHQRVVILGASHKPERYSNMAMKDLLKAGHEVMLVSPALKEIDGLPVLSSIGEVTGAVDTLAMYVNPTVSTQEAERIVALKPRRTVFAPGTENPELMQQLRNHGLEAIEACPLVMLRTGTF